MERVSCFNCCESRLWRLLEEENLADLSQFHQRGFFDEVPLFSREAGVEFLPCDPSEANEVLLKFALKFLSSVIAYEQHPRGYVAAITLWDFSELRLVPNLLAGCVPLSELEEKLVLKAVKTPFGKHIRGMVPRLHLGTRFQVLEDTATVPDSVRVLLSPARPPYKGFATLDHFRGSHGRRND